MSSKLQPDRGVEGSALQKRTLAFLALAELLAMTLWFSASAFVPALKVEWDLATAGAAWLNMSGTDRLCRWDVPERLPEPA